MAAPLSGGFVSAAFYQQLWLPSQHECKQSASEGKMFMAGVLQMDCRWDVDLHIVCPNDSDCCRRCKVYKSVLLFLKFRLLFRPYLPSVPHSSAPSLLFPSPRGPVPAGVCLGRGAPVGYGNGFTPPFGNRSPLSSPSPREYRTTENRSCYALSSRAAAAEATETRQQRGCNTRSARCERSGGALQVPTRRERAVQILGYVHRLAAG